jgi:bifunctional non-homologous end joining protein LigD
VLDQKIIPMEPVPHPEPFDSEEHLFQVKWDGVRMLAFVDHGQVRLQNRRQRDRTTQYPELQALTDLISGPTAILDGEVVAFHQGRVSFPSVLRRDQANRPEYIALLMEQMPVTYILFDLLYLDGKDLTGQPLLERHSLLADILSPHPQIVTTDNFTSGTALFTTIKAQELEGMVAKVKNSPYLPGKNHHHWLKIKLRQQQLCVVGGYTTRGSLPNALLVGAFDETGLRYLGRVGSGLSQQQSTALSRSLPELHQTRSPFVNPPQLPTGSFHWVIPVLTLMVEFAEWTPEMHLRAPVVKGFTVVPPEQCVLY